MAGPSGIETPNNNPARTGFPQTNTQWAIMLLLLALVVAGVLAILIHTGAITLPAYTVLNPAFFNIFFVIANALGASALVLSIQNSIPKHKTLRALLQGLTSAVTATATLSWVPMLVNGTFITHAGGSALFKALAHWGHLTHLSAHTQVFAMIGILAASVFAIAAIGQLMHDWAANRLDNSESNPEAGAKEISASTLLIHALGGTLRLAPMAIPFLLMLNIAPSVIPLLALPFLGIAIVNTAKAALRFLQPPSKPSTPTQDPGDDCQSGARAGDIIVALGDATNVTENGKKPDPSQTPTIVSSDNQEGGQTGTTMDAKENHLAKTFTMGQKGAAP